MKDEFCYSFKNASFVILCPIYKAGENLKLNLDYYKFAGQISKKSKVQVFFINNKYLSLFKEVPKKIEDIYIGPNYELLTKVGHLRSTTVPEKLINR